MKDEISAILLSPREEDRVKVYADGLLISDAPASPRKAAARARRRERDN